MTNESAKIQLLTREEAIAAGWREANNNCGTVTQAWDEWFLIDQDQRRFLDLTLGWSRQQNDSAWEQAESEPAFRDSPDVADRFHDLVGGLWPEDCEWMIC